MLQNIVFQDNIFQLVRSIDTLKEGLMLDLSPDYFFEKTVDDILFFDSSIQKIYRQLTENQRIAGFLSIMQNLNSCERRYLQLLDAVLAGKTAMAERFPPLISKLHAVRENHTALARSMGDSIAKNDRSGDSDDIVSRNELSELLNF